MRPELRLRRGLLLALLALAHLALWWGLDRGLHVAKPEHQTARLSELRLIVQALPRPAARPQPPREATRRPARTPPQAITVPQPQYQAQAGPVAEPSLPAQDSASAAAVPQELLLNSEATRRALREAGKSPLLSERAAGAMGDGPPLSPEEKLGRQIQQAASGDCLKGEFVGAGMGLLSLPFWALAEARGKCRR